LNGEDEPGTIETDGFSFWAIETGTENISKNSDVRKEMWGSNLLELRKRAFILAKISLIGI
jgi:hypothetical protein